MPVELGRGGGGGGLKWQISSSGCRESAISGMVRMR